MFVCQSAFQYMFMMPTFTTIFAIYSFCNIHDISWGTRGAEEEEQETEAVRRQMGDDQGLNFLDVKQREEQIKANKRQYDVEYQRKMRLAKSDREDKMDVESEFKSFRSALLLAWILTNALFSFLVMSHGINRKGYIAFLFLSVLIFVGMRFIGSLYFICYLNVWLLYRRCVKDSEQKRKRNERKEQKKKQLEQRQRDQQRQRQRGRGGGMGV